jgi:hypothetical protein
MFPDDAFIEPSEILCDIFSVSATIENLNCIVWESSPQFISSRVCNPPAAFVQRLEGMGEDGLRPPCRRLGEAAPVISTVETFETKTSQP